MSGPGDLGRAAHQRLTWGGRTIRRSSSRMGRLARATNGFAAPLGRSMAVRQALGAPTVGAVPSAKRSVRPPEWWQRARALAAGDGGPADTVAAQLAARIQGSAEAAASSHVLRSPAPPRLAVPPRGLPRAIEQGGRRRKPGSINYRLAPTTFPIRTSPEVAAVGRVVSPRLSSSPPRARRRPAADGDGTSPAGPTSSPPSRPPGFGRSALPGPTAAIAGPPPPASPGARPVATRASSSAMTLPVPPVSLGRSATIAGLVPDAASAVGGVVPGAVVPGAVAHPQPFGRFRPGAIAAALRRRIAGEPAGPPPVADRPRALRSGMGVGAEAPKGGVGPASRSGLPARRLSGLPARRLPGLPVRRQPLTPPGASTRPVRPLGAVVQRSADVRLGRRSSLPVLSSPVLSSPVLPSPVVPAAGQRRSPSVGGSADAAAPARRAPRQQTGDAALGRTSAAVVARALGASRQRDPVAGPRRPLLGNAAPETGSVGRSPRTRVAGSARLPSATRGGGLMAATAGEDWHGARRSANWQVAPGLPVVVTGAVGPSRSANGGGRIAISPLLRSVTAGPALRVRSPAARPHLPRLAEPGPAMRGSVGRRRPAGPAGSRPETGMAPPGAGRHAAREGGGAAPVAQALAVSVESQWSGGPFSGRGVPVRPAATVLGRDVSVQRAVAGNGVMAGFPGASRAASEATGAAVPARAREKSPVIEDAGPAGVAARSARTLRRHHPSPALRRATTVAVAVAGDRRVPAMAGAGINAGQVRRAAMRTAGRPTLLGGGIHLAGPLGRPPAALVAQELVRPDRPETGAGQHSAGQRSAGRPAGGSIGRRVGALVERMAADVDASTGRPMAAKSADRPPTTSRFRAGTAGLPVGGPQLYAAAGEQRGGRPQPDHAGNRLHVQRSRSGHRSAVVPAPRSAQLAAWADRAGLSPGLAAAFLGPPAARPGSAPPVLDRAGFQRAVIEHDTASSSTVPSRPTAMNQIPAATTGRPGEIDDETIQLIVDAVEQRVLEQLERRGLRYHPEVF